MYTVQFWNLRTQAWETYGSFVTHGQAKDAERALIAKGRKARIMIF